MYCRRWNLNSKVVTVMMTTWIFILCLSFHCLFAADIIVTATATNNPPPKFKGKFLSSSSSGGGSNSRQQTGTTNPRAITTSSVPILPTTSSSSPDSPDDQLQRPYHQQQQRGSHKSIGYVAEWEYEGSSWQSSGGSLDEVVDEPFGTTDQVSPLGKGENSNQPGKKKEKSSEEGESHHPSKRVGPGTWQDSSGSWWLFGGQGPSSSSSSQSKTSDSTTTGSSNSKSIRYLSDLWIYEHEKSSWRLVFRPESETSPIHSSYPENLAFPHICGSEANGHMAVFGGGGATGSTTNMKTSTTHNAQTISFTDDNIVWLFDIPRNGGGGGGDKGGQQQQQQQQQQQLDSWDGGEGLWTSYICCDACLPDDTTRNTTLEFCPRFSREPILWCGHDSLMALQISHSDQEHHHPTAGESGGGEPPGMDGKEESLRPRRQKRQSSSQGPAAAAGVADGAAVANGHIKINTSLPVEKSGEKSRDGSARVVNRAKSNVVAGDAEEIIFPNGNFNGKEARDISAQEKEREEREGEEEGQQKSEINTSTPPSSLLSMVDGKSFKENRAIGEGGGEEMRRMKKKSPINSNTRAKKTTTMENMRRQQQQPPRRKEHTLRATWWKFDLGATEWEKMPEVREESVTNGALELIEQGDCRTVSDQTMVYILCPTATAAAASSSGGSENVLERSVMVFDPSKSSIELVDGRMELNNAFRDGKVWQLGRSTLHALRTDNQMTILFLAYHKLLDLWIHDHTSNQLFAVENVWKGSSLHVFQRTASFYKITISFPNPSSNNKKNSSSPSSSSTDEEDGSNYNQQQEQSETKNYSFYMSNPRSKLFEFSDDSEYFTGKDEEDQHVAWMSSGRFHISIVTDQSVFLPSRDASFYLINQGGSGSSSRSNQGEEEKDGSQVQLNGNRQSKKKEDNEKSNEGSKEEKADAGGGGGGGGASALAKDHFGQATFPLNASPLNSTIPSSLSLSPFSPPPPPSSPVEIARPETFSKTTTAKISSHQQQQQQQQTGFKPAKMIASKSGRKIVSDNGPTVVVSSSSSSEIIGTRPMSSSTSQVETTTTRTAAAATPILSSSSSSSSLIREAEQKLTSQSEFNLSHLDSRNRGQELQEEQNNSQSGADRLTKSRESDDPSMTGASRLSTSNNNTTSPITISQNDEVEGLTETSTIIDSRSARGEIKSKLIMSPSLSKVHNAHAAASDDHDEILLPPPPPSSSSNYSGRSSSSRQFNKETAAAKRTIYSNNRNNNNLHLNSSSNPLASAVAGEEKVNLSPSSVLNLSTSSSPRPPKPTVLIPTLLSIAKSQSQVGGGVGGGGSSNPKRIPKNLNVKALESDRVVGKASNLLAAVRKPSSNSNVDGGGGGEPLKHNSDAASFAATGRGKKREEIVNGGSIVDENESLRTNRMVGRNSSRDNNNRDDHEHDHDHDEEDLGGGGGRGGRRKGEEEKSSVSLSKKSSALRKTTNTSPPPPQRPTTVRSQNQNVEEAEEDNDEDERGSVHVTLSYTMARSNNKQINSPENNNNNNKDDEVVGESSEQQELPEEHEEEDESESERERERSNSLTYGSSEIVLDAHDTIRPIGVHDGSLVPSMGTSYSSMLFFAVSLSIFGTFGIVLFFRRCVKCPPRTTESVLIKEPPPIRYSVIPDELSYHTPIV